MHKTITYMTQTAIDDIRVALSQRSRKGVGKISMEKTQRARFMGVKTLKL